ncbi:hypothetical protein FS749_008851 [Ceratobasidium sp. UAMH 11750]|nr:hypothetical protein FS749_008851 [Ceratobasidium sp. UAMH 11750]
MPAALVPRPWDFVDPPMMSSKPGRSVTPGPATQEALAPVMMLVVPATNPEDAEATEAIGEAVFSTEVRDGEAVKEDEIEKVESPNDQEEPRTATEGATTEITATASCYDHTDPTVLSGDTLVLRGAPGPQGQPPKERILHLAEIVSPRIGTASKEDEPWAYECREFLRQFAVGKAISFTSTFSLPPKDDILSDFGNAEINGQNVATEVLRAGFARCKEIKREPTEEDTRRKELENEARNGMVGMWNPQGPKDHNVQYTMPVDSAAFINEWKGKNIDGIVEQVRDGSTLRVRLLMPEDQHQFANISLAGVRCPRASGRDGEAAEEWGEEAKFFVESRLLQRVVRVQILSLPAPTSTPFASTSPNAPPPSASIFIGNVLHPNGNIAEFLVAAGLARVVDWHAGMLAAGGAMERLRAAEKTAKEKRLNLYSKVAVPAKAIGGAAPVAQRGAFDATVVRVWSGDQVSIVEKGGKDRRVQLSSVRAPKASEPKQAYYANEAREFLRKKLIGKYVKVNVDFVRPKEGEFEERDAVTIRYGNAQSNIAEQLIEKGLATALRHKRDDESRSSEYDKLMAAEQK